MAENPAFVVLCDKSIELDVNKLVANLEDRCGKTITFRTYQDIQLAKGKNFGDKLKKILNGAKAVIVISSKNFSAFIKSGEKDNLPDILKQNSKEVKSALNDYFKSQMKNPSGARLFAVSVNGDVTLPKIIEKIPLVQNNGDNEKFLSEICSRVAALVNQ